MDKVDPLVPYPAPAVISPVGFSSISIFIISKALSWSLSLIWVLTDLNIPEALSSLIDLLNKILLKGSPSSTRNLSRIYSSEVMLFPNIFIFST